MGNLERRGRGLNAAHEVWPGCRGCYILNSLQLQHFHFFYANFLKIKKKSVPENFKEI